MQKKVLALAVAGLLSGAAFAQTAVTFGGSIAMDVTQASDHSYTPTAGLYNSRFSVDDSNWQGSRLWWKAQEDLGNGLAVEAYQEMRMKTDSRAAPVNRRSYLQLSSKTMGTIKGLGGFGNVLDDALGLSEAKSADWGKGVINPLTTGGDTNDTAYNTVQYISPDFSGFKLKLSASGNDISADEENGNGKQNVRSYGLNGTYLNGPIKVAVAHLRKAKDSNALKETIVSGMYDFGMFQLGAAYAYSKNDKLGNYLWKLYNKDTSAAAGAATYSTSEWKKNGWRVNLGADITPMDHVGLSYSYAKVKFADGTQGENVKGIGLSYTHMLSKRTTFLAEYANVSMDENRAPLPGQYQSIFKVGMRHDF